MYNELNHLLSEQDANVMAVLARWWRLCGREVCTVVELRERMRALDLGTDIGPSLALLVAAGYVSWPSSGAIALTDAGRALALKMHLGKVALAA